MPSQDSVDPTWFDVSATQLSRAGTVALEASRELLAHYADTGHDPSQRALDRLVDNAAATLGALADSFSDTSCVVQQAALPGQRLDHGG